MAVKPGNQKISKTTKSTKSKPRDVKRAKTDSFLAIHFKQAKASFAALWRRPLGNILTLAVISMALALPASLYLLSKISPRWLSEWLSLLSSVFICTSILQNLGSSF